MLWRTITRCYYSSARWPPTYFLKEYSQWKPNHLYPFLHRACYLGIKYTIWPAVVFQGHLDIESYFKTQFLNTNKARIMVWNLKVVPPNTNASPPIIAKSERLIHMTPHRNSMGSGMAQIRLISCHIYKYEYGSWILKTVTALIRDMLIEVQAGLLIVLVHQNCEERFHSPLILGEYGNRRINRSKTFAALHYRRKTCNMTRGAGKKCRSRRW